jgi:hypothetical protein
MSLAIGPAISDAMFRPSTANRWLVCHGSVALCWGIGDSAGSFAAWEGTAVHLIGEKGLRNEQEPIEWLDRTISVQGHDIHVTEEMVEGAQMYIDHIRGSVSRGAQLEIEARLSLAPLDPSNPLLESCRGTSDAMLLWPKTELLEVDDLKFGKGYMVPANTVQLRLYGLMGLIKHAPKHRIRHVRTTILQPRDPDDSVRIRSHDYDAQEIWEFAGTVYEAMHNAMQPNAKLTPGEEQCQYCPARGHCPALAHNALELARAAFASVTPTNSGSLLPGPGPTPDLPEVISATGQELATWLDRRAAVELWFKAVEEKAAAACQAGIKVPGYKMVQRTGNRKFSDPDNVPPKLRELGVKTSQMYSAPKLLTPAQIEKLIPKERHAELASFVNRADNGLALVRDTDKRPAFAGVFGPAPKISVNP